MRGIIKAALELSMVLILVATPAFSGGIVKFADEGEHYNKKEDVEMLTNYGDKGLVSGVAIHVDINTSSISKMGEDAPFGTFDHLSTLNATEDVYYARSLSWVSQNSSQYGEREVTAESYIIMPKKFDAKIAMDMHFSDENESQAKMKSAFIYDGVLYEFFDESSNISENNELSLKLYPYCPQFDGLDLDYENSYMDNIAADDFNYEGSFVMRALKTEG